MSDIIFIQKEGYRQILDNNIEIHNAMTSANQQSREYYALKYVCTQKVLSGMKARLGKIE